MYSLCILFNRLSSIIIEDQENIDSIPILTVNKAIGPNWISHKMLKLTKFAISKPLCLLFNKSLEENTFPEFWI